MQPNVIVIHTDQHRQECLGAYGNRDIKTPNIDRLAKDGVLYANHFCPYPVCTPSRYSLLTGMYPSAHRGINNHCTLPPGIATFASELRRAGYRTAAVGKMHFTPTYLDVGFDEMALAEQDGPGRFDDDYHKYLRERDLLDEIDLYDQRGEYRKNAPEAYFDSLGSGVSDLPREHHSTTYITGRALERIDRFGADGNLLMVGYIKPHHPMDPPEPYASMYNPDELSLLDGYTVQVPEADKGYCYYDNEKLTEDKLREVMAMYYGTITHIDDGVGLMIDTLKEKGLYDDALILFTSDHGEYLGYRHMLLKGGEMYDPLVKIPLIIKYPASWEKRGVEDALSSNIDIARTILSVCGLPPTSNMQGFDLAGRERRDVVICEQSRGLHDCDYMARTKTQKLLLSARKGTCRFFDLARDPLEMTDLADDPKYHAVIGELKGLLLNEMLLHGNRDSHLDYDAPVINGKTREEIEGERAPMIAYMREKSTVKPEDCM